MHFYFYFESNAVNNILLVYDPMFFYTSILRQRIIQSRNTFLLFLCIIHIPTVYLAGRLWTPSEKAREHAFNCYILQGIVQQYYAIYVRFGFNLFFLREHQDYFTFLTYANICYFFRHSSSVT